MKRTVKIGLLGCGTVGGGVLIVLNENKKEIAQKAGCSIEVKTVLVRDKNKLKPEIEKYNVGFTDNLDDILNDPEIDMVVELMGRVHPAKEYIEAALMHGKHVITANKDVLAEYGKSLFTLAAEKQLDFQFEGAVGGGIPIIRPLRSCLAANNITSVMGIVNGTTNYMLTRMTEAGLSYENALAEAQEKGYAESDPTADVEGIDAARKITVLASLAFNTALTLKDVHIEGIDNVEARDISYARELGYVVKLLGVAKNDPENGITANVYPVMLPKNHPLASVNDVYNAIYVNGDAVGDAMFMGRGAGRLPTASAVCGDIIDTARNICHNACGRITGNLFVEKKMCPPEQETEPCYFRLLVNDRPGVLAAIASTFAAQQMSIASVIQKNVVEKGLAELIIITYKVSKLSLELSLRTLQVLPVVKKVCCVLRVEDPNL